MELEGTVGILTGASRGIGAELAQGLARAGVDLALAARSESDLETIAGRVRKHGRRALVCPTDVSDVGTLGNLVARTEEELGQVDLLVNNAGLEIAGYSHTLDVDEIARVVSVNLTGLIQLSRLVLPGMMARKKGHICNIASAAGKIARPYATVYSATKHGVVGFSWSLRAEMAEHGVEVTVVCPAYVSDVGMFAERSRALGVASTPAALKPVSPARVVADTLDAIRKNRAEVVVGPPLAKVAGFAHSLSPDFAIGIGRRSGAHRFMKKEATGD